MHIGFLVFDKSYHVSCLQKLRTYINEVNQFSNEQECVKIHNSVGSNFITIATNQPIQENDNRNGCELILGKRYANKNIDRLENDTLPRFWGNYLSIIAKNITKETIFTVGEIASGFYYLNLPFGLAFGSDIIDLINVFLRKTTLNESYIRNYLLNGDLLTSNTVFEEISELPAGCQLKMVGNRIVGVTNQLNSLLTQDINLTKGIVYTAIDVVENYIKPYKKLYIDLSGGLDSTSIAYVTNYARSSKQEFQAINIFHPKITASNELPFAKKVCARLGINLIEFDSSNYLPFDEFYFPKKPNKPGVMLLHGARELAVPKLLGARHDTLFINGEGGDSVFLRPPLETLLCDQIVDKGFIDLNKKALDLATYFRKPVISIYLKNLIVFLKYITKVKNKYRTTKDHIAPWLYNSFVKKFSHQLVSANFLPDFNVLPGKIEQYFGILRLARIMSIRWRGTNNTFSPLLTFPVIGEGMHFKTYDLMYKQWDRFPYRKEVSDFFSTDLVWRKSKGEFTGVVQLGLKKNFARINDIIMNGYCVRNKLINSNVLLNNIKLMSDGVSCYWWPFIHLYTLEIFLEEWKK